MSKAEGSKTLVGKAGMELSQSNARTLKPLAVSVEQLTSLIPAGRTSIYAMIKSGDLRTCKLGRRTLILMDSVEALIERNTVQQPRNER